MELSEIHSYPLKSAGGMAHSEVRLEDRGPLGDRRWMLVGANGVFLSQRTLPRMALISVQQGLPKLVCAAPDMDVLAVDPPEEGGTISVRLFDDEVEVVECGQEAASWFSNFLAHPCRLVYQSARSLRPVDPHFAAPGTPVSLADAFPLLLIGEGSLEDLNRRLADPVKMNRFRPNLVVRGSEPFAEDGWRRICVGGVEFAVVKPCARCTIPGVDPQTGIMGKEPLLTLAKYRRVQNMILFGQNLLPSTTGVVRVGDAVTVLE